MNALSRAQQAQLAKEIAASASSEVKEWDQVPEIKKFKHTIELKGKQTTINFEQMIDKYTDLTAEIEYRQKIQKELKEGIEAAILLGGGEKVTCIGYNVSRVTKQGSRKIVPELLVKNGVTPEIIAASTVVGDESNYIMIRKAKEEKF